LPANTKTYNLQEELAGKYGKSHVFKVSSFSQYEKVVVKHNYPVIILFYKE